MTGWTIVGLVAVLFMPAVFGLLLLTMAGSEQSEKLLREAGGVYEKCADFDVSGVSSKATTFSLLVIAAAVCAVPYLA